MAIMYTIEQSSVEYPEQLKYIPNSPEQLYVLGELEALYKPSIAIVGTRKPTDYGERVATKLGTYLAEQGIPVVSGLAEGCDQWAHRGCVNTGGQAVGVLGHGFQMMYPDSAESLAQELLASSGCLVTEYAVGTGVKPWQFVARNRIQSGLAVGVMVIETDVTGGTTHTVNHARVQGRPVAVVKHPEIYQQRVQARGNQQYLEDEWATPIYDLEDFKRWVSSCL